MQGDQAKSLLCSSGSGAMVGDGGNDSGALRTAHVGCLDRVRAVLQALQVSAGAIKATRRDRHRMALSSATSATVVAPFTTCRPSVAPIADLLREGRGLKHCHDLSVFPTLVWDAFAFAFANSLMRVPLRFQTQAQIVTNIISTCILSTGYSSNVWEEGTKVWVTCEL